MQVVAVEQPYLHSTDVALFVRCGSRHELASQWGLAHFVEHMLFRGSAEHPDSLTLARAMERAGSMLAASTYRDHTQFSATVHPSRVEGFLRVLGGMMARPVFDGIDVERAIVEEELRGDLDSAGHDVNINNVSRAHIWNDHPMGRRITGSVESLQGFAVDDVQAHHAKHYVGSNAVLCVAGPLKARDVVAIAEEAFAGLPQGSRTSDGEVARFVASQRLLTRRIDASQLSVQLTFEALPDPHDDFVAQQFLTRILDDGIGSRLQQGVCEKRGLVYEMTTGLDCYADCGLYDIELRVQPRRAATAIAATLDVLEKLCVDGVTDSEVEDMRERSMHELEYRVDSTTELAAHFGAATLFETVKADESFSVEASRIGAVTGAQVTRVARRLFTGGQFLATVIGPIERANMKKIEQLVDGFAAG
jgi:predicted Zn-dependent peptidase